MGGKTKIRREREKKHDKKNVIVGSIEL